jgi:hypothetical protein
VSPFGQMEWRMMGASNCEVLPLSTRSCCRNLACTHISAVRKKRIAVTGQFFSHHAPGFSTHPMLFKLRIPSAISACIECEGASRQAKPCPNMLIIPNMNECQTLCHVL